VKNLIFVEPEIKVVDLITFIDTLKNNPKQFGFQLYSVLIDKKLDLYVYLFVIKVIRL
jgi:hypothetical protein